MINPFKEINWKPSRADLRKFAVSLIIGFPCIAAAFFLARWAADRSMPAPSFFVLLGGIGAGTGILCLAAPVIARPLYHVWYALAACVGIVMANLLFTVVYYALFVPLGLFMRLKGRDVLGLKFKRGTDTYWREAPPAAESTEYFRQF